MSNTIVGYYIIIISYIFCHKLSYIIAYNFTITMTLANLGFTGTRPISLIANYQFYNRIAY